VISVQQSLGSAERNHRNTFEIKKRLTESVPEDVNRRSDFAVAHAKLGDISKAEGRSSEALRSYEDAAAIASDVLQAVPSPS
jgi:hypothetical protein